MSYLPDSLPGPEPAIDDKVFWAFCQKKELRFQKCGQCGRVRHPPAPGCQKCGSFEIEWVEAPDEAEIFSFTIVHHAAHEAVRDVLPYNIAIVIYPSLDDVRIISNVVGTANEHVAIGRPVALVWEKAGNGMWIPRYRLKATI